MAPVTLDYNSTVENSVMIPSTVQPRSEGSLLPALQSERERERERGAGRREPWE